MTPLNSIPRLISRKTRLDYALGHPLTTVGTVAASLGAMVFWLILAGYGIGLLDLMGRHWSEDFYAAKVESSAIVRLWTGEPTPLITALFEFEGKTYRAVGYGDGADKADLGSEISVNFPVGLPHKAKVAGFQQFPIGLGSLARITVVLLAPGLFISLLGLILGLRQLRLLNFGRAGTVKVKRSVPLPRPLKGSRLVQWMSRKQVAPNSFWSLVDGEPEDSQALFGGSRLMGAILVPETMEEQLDETKAFEDPKKARRRRRWGNVLLALVQLSILGLFLWT